jgi:hypothetical protein
MEALSFLEKNLWTTQNWLINKELVSQIKGEGILNTIQELQINALNRFLSVEKLNRMLSAQESLNGDALKIEMLLDNLFLVLVKKHIKPDLYQQRLQLHFIERIKYLMDEKKLNPIIKGLLLELKGDIKRIAFIKSILSKGNQKAHFTYLKRSSN